MQPYTTITIENLRISSLEAAKDIGFAIDSIIKTGGNGTQVALTDPIVSKDVDHNVLLNSGIAYEQLMGSLIKDFRKK